MTHRPAGALRERIATQLDRPLDPAIRDFACALAAEAQASAVLFYGSNLRTGSLEGVLDFYVLTPGPPRDRIWPRVSYHERPHGDVDLRAKVATMSLETFAKAAAGELTDTTIWARFVQPSALAWESGKESRALVVDAIAVAAQTAARLAVALGPVEGSPDAYWRALFRSTYEAEFRVEKAGRENDILAVNAEHFEGLLPLALDAAGVAYDQKGRALAPEMHAADRTRVLKWWRRRKRMGKPLNLLRLLKASITFDGATRYAAWKIERHTGMPVEVTPFREHFPILAAPGVLFALWRHRRKR
ncbi:MAG: hypothetical protein AAGK02_13015 [Pseudomonadota bacterium]